MHAKEDNQEIPRNRIYHETSSAGLIAESAAPDKNVQVRNLVLSYACRICRKTFKGMVNQIAIYHEKKKSSKIP
ncbi:hypothetical protein DPMN_056558 [Dreissena polymorpha]|uniref:Uncharacterized protein n=1 Tax=Dreissena polymorpha TaxID=45954 RepID=A0A9D4CUM0_DREPO|nr:hypothetical protein DPMN_056558 [Dreissena polymorpha]